LKGTSTEETNRKFGHRHCVFLEALNKQQISSNGRSWGRDLKPVAPEFNQKWKAHD